MSTPSDPNPQDRPAHEPTPGYGQPAAPGYNEPGYGPGAAAPKNGLGTAALVLGIIGLLLAFIPVIGILGGLLGIVGVILGVIARGKVKRGDATNGGVALVGIILSVLAILITIAYVVLAALFFNQVEDCTDPNLTPEEVTACVEDNLGG
ncbi:MAG TPA: DUF4190 domain-containing protein [Actinomycetales bacterium]|nr:DUF4190 domain-containing protein [Actinomycetales bacterium]